MSMTEEHCSMESMDKDTSKRGVDYYYLEAMRCLSCEDHHSDDSDPDHSCSCRRCRKEDDNSNNGDKDQGSPNQSFASYNEASSYSGRERSWTHSVDDFESGTISQLPNLEGKIVGGRLKSRRYSDGMLIKPHMNFSNGHVQWADDCKKELIRCRPRKKYVRNPSVRPTPVKSILKHSSEESLDLHNLNEDSDSD